MVAIVSTMSTWLSGSLHWISSTLIRNCVHCVWICLAAWNSWTKGQNPEKKMADSSPLRSRRPWWTPWNAPVQCLFVNWKAPTSPNMQLLNPSICTSLHWFRRLCRSLCCLELCWSMIGRCNPRTTLEDVIGDLGWNYDTPQSQTINKGSQTNSKPQTTVPATVLRCVSTWILFHTQGQRGWLPWRF